MDHVSQTMKVEGQTGKQIIVQ